MKLSRTTGRSFIILSFIKSKFTRE